jgi:hypothetical protein
MSEPTVPDAAVEAYLRAKASDRRLGELLGGTP